MMIEQTNKKMNLVADQANEEISEVMRKYAEQLSQYGLMGSFKVDLEINIKDARATKHDTQVRRGQTLNFAR